MLPIMVEEFICRTFQMNEVEARTFVILMAAIVMGLTGILVWRFLKARLLSRRIRTRG